MRNDATDAVIFQSVGFALIKKQNKVFKKKNLKNFKLTNCVIIKQ